MRGRTGFVLLEVLVGVAIWAVVVLACGRVLGQAAKTQRAAQRHWRLTLACRSALEVTCAALDSGDSTMMAFGGLAEARIETVHVGMVRVTAAPAGGHAFRGRAGFTRLVWRGRGR